MKLWLALLVTGMTLLALAYLCGRPGVPDAPALVAPSEVILDAHRIADIADANFTISNHGNRPLMISEFRTACGCDSLEKKSGQEYVRLGNVDIQPGGSVEIRLRQKVRGRAGEEMRTGVYCLTNDPSHPEVVVAIVIPTLTGGTLAAPSAIDFGMVASGATVSRTVELFDNAANPRNVTGVSSSNPTVLSARMLPRDSNQPTRDQFGRGSLIGRMEIVVRSESPATVDGKIGVSLDDGDFTPDTVTVSGRVVSAVQASPSSLLLPRSSSSGMLYEATCVCRSMTGKSFRLQVVEVPKGLSSAVTDTPAPSQTVVIRCEGNARSMAGTVRLLAKWDGGEEQLAIPVRIELAP